MKNLSLPALIIVGVSCFILSFTTVIICAIQGKPMMMTFWFACACYFSGMACTSAIEYINIKEGRKFLEELKKNQKEEKSP